MKLTVEVIGKTAEVTFLGTLDEFKVIHNEFEPIYHLEKFLETFAPKPPLEVKPTEVPLTKLHVEVPNAL